MISFKLSVLFIASAYSLLHVVENLEIQFDRIELINGSYAENLYNISLLRVGKFNRTTYVLNFEGELFVDIPIDLSIEAAFYYNRFNNNQFYKTPARIPKESICSVGNKYYTNFLMAQLEDCSNFPQLGKDEPFCPFSKVSQFDIFLKKFNENKFTMKFNSIHAFLLKHTIPFSGQVLGQKLCPQASKFTKIRRKWLLESRDLCIQRRRSIASHSFVCENCFGTIN